MHINIMAIEEIRKERGYSRKYVAEYLNYTTSAAYSMKVIGKRQFNLNDLLGLASLFSVEITELLK